MKKRNGEDPERLGGLGELLPVEVLKKLEQLLEFINQADGNKQGSKIELVYVASGGQHVETQIIASPYPPPYRGGREPLPSPLREERGIRKGGGVEEPFRADTPLSALFRENHHEELRKVVESWRPYLIDDDTTVDTVAMTQFEFDKDRIYSNKVYRDLCELDALGALQVPLSQLARYLAEHSNLSRSYATLYQQLKNYRSEWA